MNHDRTDPIPIRLDLLDLVYLQSSNVDHMAILLAQSRLAAQLDHLE